MSYEVLIHDNNSRHVPDGSEDVIGYPKLLLENGVPLSSKTTPESSPPRNSSMSLGKRELPALSSGHANRRSEFAHLFTAAGSCRDNEVVRSAEGNLFCTVAPA